MESAGKVSSPSSRIVVSYGSSSDSAIAGKSSKSSLISWIACWTRNLSSYADADDCYAGSYC